MYGFMSILVYMELRNCWFRGNKTYTYCISVSTSAFFVSLCPSPNTSSLSFSPLSTPSTYRSGAKFHSNLLAGFVTNVFVRFFRHFAARPIRRRRFVCCVCCPLSELHRELPR